jgi:hypothetical protein
MRRTTWRPPTFYDRASVCGIRARDALTGDVLDIAASSFSTPWAMGGAAAAAAPRSPARASAFLLKGCEFRRRTSVD